MGTGRWGLAGVTLVVLLALGGCSGGSGGERVVLAKVDGWRDRMPADAPFAVLELAYDAETARELWDANVPADLPERDGAPVEPGVYADLADVDFSRQVVGLYSSGQSGSCPGWPTAVRTDDGGSVVVETDLDLGGGEACTDDYNPYRAVVVVDRGDVPAPDVLDDSVRGEVGGLEVLVVAYPAP